MAPTVVPYLVKGWSNLTQIPVKLGHTSQDITRSSTLTAAGAPTATSLPPAGSRSAAMTVKPWPNHDQTSGGSSAAMSNLGQTLVSTPVKLLVKHNSIAPAPPRSLQLVRPQPPP
jgi:hypothetical protein